MNRFLDTYHSKKRRNLRLFPISKIKKKEKSLTHSDLEEAKINGELHFFFSVDMREFLFDSNNERISNDAFENLQGSGVFAEALSKMAVFFPVEKIQGPWKSQFIYDAKSLNRLSKRGFDSGFFGAVLSKDWLKFPTSIFEGKALSGKSGKWVIRCSWLGLFEVHLITEINNQTSKDVLRDILNSSSTTNDDTSVWKLVFEKIKEFCELMPTLTYKDSKGKEVLYNLSPELFSENPEKYPTSFAERQRYVVISATDIRCKKYGDNRLPASELLNSNLLPALLYAALISDRDNSNADKIPEWENNQDNKIVNLSTWKNEICVFSSERGFIYYDSDNTVKGKQTFSYDEYWQYIIRGIQHTVSVRAALQSLQTQIRKRTDELPELISKLDKEEYPIDHLASSLANILQIMPQISNVCIPTVAFKANYAVSKFQYLNEKCFRFSEILIALRRDIRSISAFLEFSKSHQLRLEVEKRRKQDGKQNLYWQIFGLVITFMTFVLIGPSFINDYTVIRDEIFKSKELTLAKGKFILEVSNYYFIFIVLLLVVSVAFIIKNISKGKERDKKNPNSLSQDKRL